MSLQFRTDCDVSNRLKIDLIIDGDLDGDGFWIMAAESLCRQEIVNKICHPHRLGWFTGLTFFSEYCSGLEHVILGHS